MQMNEWRRDGANWEKDKHKSVRRDGQANLFEDEDL